MSRLSVISQELREEILREFGDVAVQASTAVLGGVNYLKDALEKSVGQTQASDILGRVASAPVPVPSLQRIVDLEPHELVNLLRREQPQTLALVASYLAPEKCSRMLTLLPADLRNRVVERLATLAPTPVDVIERIVEVLNRKVDSRPARALNQTGGLKNAAEILNSIGHALSRSMLGDLEKRNPALGVAIRQELSRSRDELVA
jgi:flagellar motor switch protein FliG